MARKLKAVPDAIEGTFDAHRLAVGWMSTALASSTDKEVSALHNTVCVEWYDDGAIGAREPMSPDEAARVFFDLATDGSWVGVDTPGEVLDRARLHDPDAVLRAIYRGTVKVHHPDRGGSRDAFDALEEAWQVLSTL